MVRVLTPPSTANRQVTARDQSSASTGSRQPGLRRERRPHVMVTTNAMASTNANRHS